MSETSRPMRNEWHDIMLDDMRNPEQEVILFAATGVPRYERSQSVTLNLTLTRRQFSQDLLREVEEATIPKPFGRQTILHSSSSGTVGSRHATAFQTSTKCSGLQIGGTATYEERVEFHRRFALPFACIAFAFVGLPLGVSTTRGSKSMGLVLSLILMFLYYLALHREARSSQAIRNFSPLLGAWIPNIAFLLAGILY